MTTTHLSMGQLLAVRDNDRSEPWAAEAHRHLLGCAQCAAELERLHQRTARLRALPTLAPGRNHYPKVTARIAFERRTVWQRRTAWLGVAAAAGLALSLVISDLIQPARLDASEQLESAINRSQELEITLHAWRPEERTLDGRTAQVILQLEDRIAAIDEKLQRGVRLDEKGLARQVELWQQRVGLMTALVDVHLTRASNVDL